MKILFISRATLFSNKGGDTTQLEKTAKFLREMNVDVHIKLSNETIDYTYYDLLHFFNIIRPADIIKHIQLSGKPFVISTIYCDYDEYDKKARGGVVGFLRSFLSSDKLEFLKVIARYIKNGEKIISWIYIFWGHKKSIQYLIKKTAMLLPNSLNEYKRLVNHYHKENKYKIIVNGIDDDWIDKISINQPMQHREGVLCVAQIEGRKNQLNLIRAINELEFPLTILGKPPANFTWFAEQCKAEAKKNIIFIERISEKELIALYHKSKVHILPSWFETTGLASLEAAAMGCNIVITDKGDTHDYFGEDAFYCEPDDIESIKNAIIRAYESPVNEKLQKRVIENYTWQKAAEQTLAAYKEILSKKE